MRPYLLSLSTVLVFLGVTYYLETLASGGVFFLLLLAVLLSGWYGGLGPGLTAAVISAVSGTYLFLPPHYAMTIERPADLMRLILFCSASVLVLGSDGAVPAHDGQAGPSQCRAGTRNVRAPPRRANVA